MLDYIKNELDIAMKNLFRLRKQGKPEKGWQKRELKMAEISVGLWQGRMTEITFYGQGVAA